MLAGTQGELAHVEIAAEGDLEAWAEQMKSLLLEAHQKDVERVKKAGLEVCSTCIWTSGCRHCSWVNTVRYWRRKETLDKHLEGYSGAYKFAVAAKAKPKAKAKLKGGGSLTL